MVASGLAPDARVARKGRRYGQGSGARDSDKAGWVSALPQPNLRAPARRYAFCTTN